MTTADKRITVYSDERIPRQIFEWQPVGLRLATEFVRTLRRLRRQHAGELDDGTVWIECEAPGGWSYGVKAGRRAGRPVGRRTPVADARARHGRGAQRPPHPRTRGRRAGGQRTARPTTLLITPEPPRSLVRRQRPGLSLCILGSTRGKQVGRTCARVRPPAASL